MKGNRAIVTAVVVVLVLILGWYLLRRSGNAGAIDLLTQFEQATKKPSPESFTLVDATLGNETKKAVAPAGVIGTRIIWKVRVPDDGWLHVNVGQKAESWDKEGDGVLFKVLVSDGKASDELFTQHVNAFGNAADRRWIPVYVDLSAYGGEQVDLIFNTYASPPRAGADMRNDMPLWGTPEIVIR